MSSLENQAAERKKRLEAIRNKRKHADESKASTEPLPKKPTNEQTFQLKSRNFDTQNRTDIKGFDAPPTALDENSETVEAVSQQIQDRILAKFRDLADAEFGNRARLNKEKIKPRSLAWDMQRDIQEDLDLLQERTDEVIRTIVKERLRTLRAEASANTED